MTKTGEHVAESRAGKKRRSGHSAGETVWDRRGARIILRIVTFIVVIVGWELYASTVSPVLLASPSAILRAADELLFPLSESEVLDAAVVSGLSLVAGLGTATVVGVLGGLLMGYFPKVGRALGPYVSFMYAIPNIAIIPLLVLSFGIDFGVRVVIIFLASVFPILINTEAGVKDVDSAYTDVGFSFYSSRPTMLRSIILPAALPLVLTGLRVAVGRSLVSVVAAEILAVLTGLGGLIVRYSNFFKTAEIFVPLGFIVAGSLALTALVDWCQRRFAPWA